MANEPERPIEKLLRAAAKKRRDDAGGPLELHPATRRLLQGEVARTFAKPGREPRSFSEALSRLWPRFAWGVAICAVLVVAGYALLPMPGKGKSEALLARNEPMSRAVPAKQSLPPPPAAPAPVLAPPAAAVESHPSTVASAETAPPAPTSPARQLGAERQALAKDSLTASADRETREQPAPAAAPQRADRQKAADAQIAASGGTGGQAPGGTINGVYQQQLGLADKPVPPASTPTAPASPPPETTAPAATSVVAAIESTKLPAARADELSFAYKAMPSVASANRPQPSPAMTDGRLQSTAGAKKEAKDIGAAQWFTQVAPGANAKASPSNKATPAHAVLASFQVAQTGSELRIVDGDGSVYSGYVRVAEAARRKRSAQTEAPAAARAPAVLGGGLAEKSAASLDADQSVPQNYFFRVVGTNRSLHKKVVFTGNLLAATNSHSLLPFTNFLSFGSDVSGGRTNSAQPNLLPLLNTRISGKVVVGNGKAVDINALPASP
jgi:hypothetical protein